MNFIEEIPVRHYILLKLGQKTLFISELNLVMSFLLIAGLGIFIFLMVTAARHYRPEDSLPD